MPTPTFSGLSFVFYEGDGSTTTFPLGFGFIDPSHIQVRIDGTTTTTGLELVNDSIVFDTPPAADTDIRINRQTPRQLSEREVDFRSWGQITEDQMDLNQRQIWYLIQEGFETNDQGDINPDSDYLQWDRLGAVWTALRDGVRQRITSVGEPSNGSDAATKDYVDDIAEWGIAGQPQSWSFTAGLNQTQYTLTGGQFLDARFLIVSIEGVIQIPGVDFTVNSGSPNSELVFSGTTPAQNQTISVQNFGKARFLNSMVLGTNAVATDALQDRSVTSPKIALLAVLEEHLADLSVPERALVAGAVTESKIAAASVGLDKLKTSGFTTAPGGTYDSFLKVDRLSGDLVLDTLSATDLSDFLAELANVRLNQLGVPNAALSMGGNRITDVTNPVGLQDAATKDYVDTAVGGGATGPKVDLLYDSTRGAAAGRITLFESNPTWLTDSTYLHYEVVVSNLTWTGSKLGFDFYSGGAWHRDTEWVPSFSWPSDRRGILSFRLWQPRDGVTRPAITPPWRAGGVAYPVFETVPFGPCEGLRLSGDNGATLIGGNLRVLVYGHRALT